MHTPDDPRSTGAQQTAQPRSRRRFLTGVVMGGFLGSLLVGGHQPVFTCAARAWLVVPGRTRSRRLLAAGGL